jgi:DNA-binding NarL/FixJ family response regulator
MARRATKHTAAGRKPAARPSARPKTAPARDPSLLITILSPHPYVLDNLRNLCERPEFQVETQRIEYLPGSAKQAGEASVQEPVGDTAPAPLGKPVKESTGGRAPTRIFVLDANGPQRAVMSLIARLKAEHPESSVVIVGDEFVEDAAFPLLRLGIRGVIRYADAPAQLAGALLSVGKGGYWVPRLLLSQFVFNILDQPSRVVGTQGETRRLSPRERQVYDALLENLSNKEIAARMNLSERTVKFHVSNVLAKFRVRRRADLILQNFHAKAVGAGE